MHPRCCTCPILQMIPARVAATIPKTEVPKT